MIGWYDLCLTETILAELRSSHSREMGHWSIKSNDQIKHLEII